MDVYENRNKYTFEDGTELSMSLPQAETPEHQVRSLNPYDFFRYVRMLGGKNPRLAWYEEQPVVTMSPVVKLTEGADFAFGARWALMQYHMWNDRHEFLAPADGGKKSDADIKAFFRTWMDSPGCPWYVRDQYFRENPQRARHA